MAPTLIYLACVAGALGLYLILRPDGPNPLRASALSGVGGLLGVAAFGWLLVQVVPALGGDLTSQGSDQPTPLFLFFSLLAIASAARMISTARPVYAALYFVLVVVASAAMFLMLEAEFIAFALVIVYAGAILITYMFVLMLAQQSPNPDDPEGVSDYDLRPREPLAGAIVGFIMIALLTRTIFDGGGALEPRLTVQEARIDTWQDLARLPGRLEEYAAREIGEAEVELALDAEKHPRLDVSEDGLTATVFVVSADSGTETPVELPDAAKPENVQSVGIALIEDFPVSLEVAGVILLMAMFGAVVLARRQIELTEDEKRTAAGMARLGHHDDDPAGAGGGAA